MSFEALKRRYADRKSSVHLPHFSNRRVDNDTIRCSFIYFTLPAAAPCPVFVKYDLTLLYIYLFSVTKSFNFVDSSVLPFIFFIFSNFFQYASMHAALTVRLFTNRLSHKRDRINCKHQRTMMNSENWFEWRVENAGLECPYKKWRISMSSID